MFGLGMSELLVLLVILAFAIAVAKATKGGYLHASSSPGDQRHCLACNYSGGMKTWLGNYNGAQFIALILLLCYFIPGLIFIAWGWGKYKCPKCGALGKNTSLGPSFAGTVPTGQTFKKCPFCAENIKDEAIKCRYCGSQLPVSS